jgi:hypothetical protein
MRFKTAYKNEFFDDKLKMDSYVKKRHGFFFNSFLKDFFHINLDAIKRVLLKDVAK